MPWSTQFSVGSAGVEVNVLQRGNGSLPSCVLVHGLGHHAHVWDHVVPELSEWFTTLAVDLCGHGDSEWATAERYRTGPLAEDLLSVLDAQGIERTVLVGHSLGGNVAIQFAARFPDRMLGMILVDSGPMVSKAAEDRILEEYRSFDRRYSSLEAYERHLASQFLMTKPAAGDQLLRYGVRSREEGTYEVKTDPQWFERGMDRGDWRIARARDEPAGVAGATPGRGDRYENRKQWQLLEMVRCPTLVLRGVASSVLPADVAERMVYEVLKNGRLAIVPMAGHGVMIDNPRGFLEASIPFLRRTVLKDWT